MAPKTSTSRPKPYDRPAKSAAKGSKAKPTPKATVDTRAPAQLAQSSRKGKKAWRKNIDLRAEEEALEAAREEERVTGSRVGERKDSDLFTIDVTGDVDVAKKVRREKKPLRSLAVLSERSAVPSWTSRASKPAAASKSKVSSYEKNRLRKIARRTVDDTASADVKETDISTLHDAWGAVAPAVVPEGGFGEETMAPAAIRAPKTLREQRQIRAAAIKSQNSHADPVHGTSYNPAAEAHATLLNEAVTEEMGRLAAEAREEESVSILGQVVDARRLADTEESETKVGGMRVGRGDGIDSDEEDEEDDTEAAAPKKPTKRKTQAQRNKALRARDAAHELKHELARKKLERAISAAKALGKDEDARNAAIERAKQARAEANALRKRADLKGGDKIGKHRVPKSAVAVQLGDELAESLRQVKPSGNRFKDTFLSLQRRALIEPRVPQLPRRKTRKVKEYEKHPWKRFE